MRKSSFAPGILFLVLALTLPVLVIAQQTRSARRATAPDRATNGANNQMGQICPIGAISSGVLNSKSLLSVLCVSQRSLR